MLELRPLGLALVIAAALAMPAAALAAPPANDAFSAAEELSGRVTTAEGLTKDATKETGEPNHAGEAGGASIWYRWTAPADGRTIVSTCGSSFDTLLAIYTGDAVDSLTHQASNNDACGVQSEAAFDAVEGVTYLIAVDGDEAATGAVALALRLAPANDDFADAEVIAGDEGAVDGTNVGSSPETDEPGYLEHSVWYRWTAPSSGPVNFETCGSDFETFVVAYTGSEIGALEYVGYADDACLYSSRISFSATAGVTYSIVVDGYGTGDFELSWNRNPQPPYVLDYPYILGTAREGETLTATDGEWSGTPPFTLSYAWDRCDEDYVCKPIEGATSKTYLLTSADIGQYIRARVQAANAAGTYMAYTDTTPPVRSRGPQSTALPVVGGTAVVGDTLTTSDGLWTGPTPIRFEYQWQACDAAGTACTNLAGDRQSFIELRTVHVGKRLRAVVTATNIDGSRSVASGASPVVVAPKVVKQVRCVVPNVRGKSLKHAKGRIRRAHCKTGRVTRAYSRSVARGRVIAQKPKAGARMKQGAPIKLVVSKGRRR